MIKNYLKVAWRNIYRNKVYTAVNVFGLALGICACIVIYLITSYEFSFDNFHPDKERIYRVMGDLTENTGEKLHFSRLPMPLLKNGRSELPGIEVMAGMVPYNAKISVPDGNEPAKHFDAGGEIIAEPQYFDIFKCDWLAGNAATALNAPFAVVLTESKARQYFGSGPLDNMVGRQIIYDDSLKVNVTGIIREWNKNTDIAFTDIISFSTIQSSFLKANFNPTSWNEGDMSTWMFVKLAKGATVGRVNTQMLSLIKTHAGPQIKLTPWLEPLSDIHFNANVIENQIRTAHKPTLYGLIGIASFILILAVVNFINLSTAQSMRRSKEVGVRKVMGSSRTALTFQFMTETLMLTIFAVLLAVSLVKPSIAAFQSFIPTGMTFHLTEPSTIIFLLLLTLVTTLLAGLYPSIVLSSHLPVHSLKGANTHQGGEKWLLRKGLIVFQFTVSLVFIISCIVITNQLNYTRKKDLGFNADAIITVDAPRGSNAAKNAVFAQKIKQISGVDNIALQWVSPMTDNGRGMRLKFKSTDVKEMGVTQIAGDENFIPLYHIKLIAGRNLEPADSVKELVINESLVKLLGYKTPGEALGKMLYWNGKPVPVPVVGVVADFHTSSLHNPIAPLCIINRPDREGAFAIKLASKGKQSRMIKSTLSQIENVWTQIYPAETFNYRFYDESLALLYEKDQQTATLLNTSMAITIFISCIGLFGLALFTAEKRAKEISIRKILGASVANIASMISKDFVILVVISLIIASPIAWYFMSKWLEGFAYHISIKWWMFALAGVVSIAIALLTVSFQSIKAALASPVKNLKTE
ncbi:MAG TPA: ABC transporter permease [Mucilaginibacter sp.]|jgi:ABC-type antimicrobial peptide transport system permease subunit